MYRINVGGKLLTNHLKEVVSFRSVYDEWSLEIKKGDHAHVFGNVDIGTWWMRRTSWTKWRKPVVMYHRTLRRICGYAGTAVLRGWCGFSPFRLLTGFFVRKPYDDNTILQEYVLPDFSVNKRGFVRVRKWLWTFLIREFGIWSVLLKERAGKSSTEADQVWYDP